MWFRLFIRKKFYAILSVPFRNFSSAAFIVTRFIKPFCSSKIRFSLSKRLYHIFFILANFRYKKSSKTTSEKNLSNSIKCLIYCTTLQSEFWNDLQPYSERKCKLRWCRFISRSCEKLSRKIPISSSE